MWKVCFRRELCICFLLYLVWGRGFSKESTQPAYATFEGSRVISKKCTTTIIGREGFQAIGMYPACTFLKVEVF